MAYGESSKRKSVCPVQPGSKERNRKGPESLYALKGTFPKD